MAKFNLGFGLGLGAGAAALKNLTKQKKITPEAIQEPEYYPRLREQIGSFLSGKIGQPERYTGEFISPLSELETAGLGRVREAGTAAAPPVLGEGAEEIRKTLAGTYDPETSAYYQAFRNKRLAELEQSKQRLDESLAGAGRFFHGGRATAQQRLESEALRDFDVTSAQLGERERERRLQAAPYGIDFAREQVGLPLRQGAALLEAGAIPRGIDQAKLLALYNEFIRQIGQSREDVGLANQFAGPVPYAYPSYGPSLLMQLEPLLRAIGSVAGGIPRG